MGKKKTKQKKVLPYEIGELDQYLFGQGTHYEIYQKMGAHKAVRDGKSGVYFAVWAPHARRVAVVGEFNEYIPALFLRQKKGICINTVLRQNKGNGFSKQILLRIMQNSVPEQLRGLQIFTI